MSGYTLLKVVLKSAIYYLMLAYVLISYPSFRLKKVIEII